MHSNVTIKNVSWPHFSWPTLYIFSCSTFCYQTPNLVDRVAPRRQMYVRNQVFRSSSKQSISQAGKQSVGQFE